MISFLRVFVVLAVVSTTFSCTPTAMVDTVTELSTDGEKGGVEEDPNGD